MHSNFITAPDLVESILAIDATDGQIEACAEACKNSGRVYNIYFYKTADGDTVWLNQVLDRVDTILISQKSEYKAKPKRAAVYTFGENGNFQDLSGYINK